MNDLEAIRQALLSNPSKDTLTELVNSAEFTNPIVKALVFNGVRTMSPEQVKKFSSIAAIAIQYIQQGNVEGLVSLGKRTGIPAPYMNAITGYVKNITGK